MQTRILSPALGALSLLLATCAMCAVPAPAQAQTAASAEDARITAFFDREFEQELELRPQLATRLGLRTGMDRLDDFSEAGQLTLLQWRRGSVARLKAQFDRSKLSPELQASYDMWVGELERAELAHRFRAYAPPLYSFLDSVHTDLPSFLVNTHPVAEASDMRGYVARLRAVPAALDTAIAETRKSAAQGIRAPRFQYESIVSGSRQLIAGAPFDASGKDSPLWADAKEKVAKLQSAGKVTPAEAQALLADARAAVLALKPAYQRVIAWAEVDKVHAKSGARGAVTLPGGGPWYAAALKLHTTTDMTPEQVHQLGLSEVARITREQDALARKAGVADAAAYYAERARRHPPAPWTDALRAEYLAESNRFVGAVRAKLPAWFGELPVHRVEVVREPSFSEVAGGAAHAAPPTPDGSRPGRAYVHLLGVTEDPAALYTLMCHEAIPGHVLQGDIQVRKQGGPRFRRGYRYVSYGEGWALYAEQLCSEMGAFPDVAADFMRLDAELFRAARLVVDTGIHAKGWTEDQAVDYMIRIGRQTPDGSRAEVRRYITWPGQATGYKIGMIRIQQLRAKAQRELGPRFDIKGFHDLVVGGGSVPLTVLDRAVDEWIARRKAAA
ncbi:DUF885 domain-containing protein [Phenylobacterium sp.]|jgi:uncharacterized protein (DUF885 family)|uniref:DUF885 domain-containing protein n=1 Tax=Phenylobacterium sp. TaxID=1871053 RepID=UPI002F9550F8